MDKSTFPQINRERASDSVYQILRDGILTQVFRPGERLNVKELADKLGVSQTPLKEAINRLAIEGLIEINPRSGTYVTTIDKDDIADTFEIRLALECLAAEKALGKMTQSNLNRMRALIAELEKPVRNDNERAIHEQTNVDFHNLIVELAGSRKLEELYHSLNAHIQIARVHHSRQDWERRTEQEQEEHGEILRAFEARDPDRLIRAIRHHIRRAASCLVEDLKNGSMAK